MNTIKELLFKGWNALSPHAQIAVIFFFVGVAFAELIRFL